MKKLRSCLIFLLIIALLTVGAAAASSVPSSVVKATQSVVRIFCGYEDGYAFGSGFVISSDDNSTLVATNYHVIEGEPEYIEILWDGKRTDATVLISAEGHDLCILQTASSLSLPVLTFDTEAKQGESVYAVGFPGAADYLSDDLASSAEDATITDGIVSAIRRLTITDGAPQTELLQTNADINSGNSGGPLLNEKGQVLGINTYGIIDSQGINGAISVSELVTLMDSVGIKPAAVFPAWAVIGIAVVVLAAAAFLLLRRKGLPFRKKQTLAQFLSHRNAPLTENEAVSLLMPVAAQLRKLHESGRTHLQISPERVVIGKSGAELLAPVEGQGSLFVSGYTAPEIYHGTSAGERSDVYSFCAILSYALTLSTPENALNRQDAEVEAESAELSGVAALADKGMSLAAEERFASMAEVIQALMPYNIGNVSALTAELFPTRHPMTQKQKRAVAIVSATAIFLLLGGYIFSFIICVKKASDGSFADASRFNILPAVSDVFDDKLNSYISAGTKFEQGNYKDAISLFKALSGYKNADELAKESMYQQGVLLLNDGDFDEAKAYFTELSEQSYKDSADMILACDYGTAYALLDTSLIEGYNAVAKMADEGYEPAIEGKAEIFEMIYQEGIRLYQAEEFESAKELFEFLGNYKKCSSYQTLISVHLYDFPSGDYCEGTAHSFVQSLLPLIGFEDTDTLLFSSSQVACDFLEGTWKNQSGCRFSLQRSGTATYYCKVSFNFDNISDGTNSSKWVWTFFDNEPEKGILSAFVRQSYSNTVTNADKLRFKALSADSISVYCYENAQTYTLYRQ